ncbi:SRPBCC family protein [Geomicrobium sediminis]|uniref:Ligand-binding SRPBCC domain-containing protein n=1 Tax=Geomicrobium sediminis TaxID=1347788 RepID=A0ABS2P7F4_9BACL|nr:SRPBCC family protein [Geomicrobium sediminis]MBM7631340.1 ligand-binding SRPBCC domain-containing protein [Geomicrobium sediminis]
MRLYTLHKKQVLPLSKQEAWEFFSDPGKLSSITPGDMKFNMRSPMSRTMHPGMIIHYDLKPLPAFPVQWVTEITHMIEERLFVDEQRFGPFRFWHHQHHFNDHPLGVEIEDIIHYVLPFGPLGTLAHRMLVEKRLEEIFEFRKQQLSQAFRS